jgi:hypothetical protein
MKAIVYILGFGHIAISACLILYTKDTVEAIRNFYQKFPLTYLAAIPALLGFLFLISASATTYPWLLRLIGILTLCEAVLAFTNPRKIYSRMLDWYFGKVSEHGQRLFGIIGIIFGTALVGWII